MNVTWPRSLLSAFCIFSGCAAHNGARSENVKEADGVEAWMLEAQAAGAAYSDERYADCARHYMQAAEASTGRAQADALYGAGICELKRAARDGAAGALDHFEKALAAHPSYCEDILSDESLRQQFARDPRWSAMAARYEPACASYRSSIHIELRKIYEEDQNDRKAAPDAIDWSVVKPRDIARFQRVRELEASAQLRTADDYYHAAMIMQHGEDESSYAEANRLAARAVAVDPTFVKARWLAAASRDRYLMARGEPQYYGTQYKRIDGKWILWPADPRATDRERAAWCVEPIESARKHAAKMNAR